MKLNPLALLFVMFLALPAACAIEKVSNKPQFHPPQTEAEKALDNILQITDKDFTMLKDVQEYLDSKNTKKFKHSRQFTVPYLQAWVKGQLEWLKGACEGRDRNTDLYYDCSYLIISCIRDANYPYVYRTEKMNTHETIISYTWPRVNDYAAEPSDSYATYRMVKNNNGWKLDGANCGDIFNME